MSSQSFPEKTCQIDRLVTNEKMVAAVAEGRKSQQRRNGVYAYPGERFDLEGETFEVVRLEHQRLGDMTEDEAQKEGFPNLDVYRDIIIRMHPGMAGSPDHKVWLHEFARVQ